MSVWAAASWVAWIVVVLLGLTLRSRTYAIFRGIVLGLHTLIILPLLPSMGDLAPVALYFHGMVFLDSACLVRPTLRPAWYRWLISLPAQYMAASTLLAFPWAIVAAFGVTPFGFWLPYLLGAFGMVQSLTSKFEQRELWVGDVTETATVSRVSLLDGEAQKPASRTALKVAQITDPHLGPFMSVRRLSKLCQELVEQEPDLVLLTGDFLTMESQADSRWLSDALAPLSALRGRVFACLGNHDHEARDTVSDALRKIGATLLVDEATTVDTPSGRVQILGFDFHFRDRAEKTAQVLARIPREPGALRLVLLHDPGAFKHLPAGEADLVLSGHTHGGQVGFVSFGGVWTVAGAVAKIPDHGYWGFGTNRMYVHRGTGHYGFPLRLGVPNEQSVLAVHRV